MKRVLFLLLLFFALGGIVSEAAASDHGSYRYGQQRSLYGGGYYGNSYNYHRAYQSPYARSYQSNYRSPYGNRYQSYYPRSNFGNSCYRAPSRGGVQLYFGF